MGGYEDTTESARVVRSRPCRRTFEKRDIAVGSDHLPACTTINDGLLASCYVPPAPTDPMRNSKDELERINAQFYSTPSITAESLCLSEPKQNANPRPEPGSALNPHFVLPRISQAVANTQERAKRRFQPKTTYPVLPSIPRTNQPKVTQGLRPTKYPGFTSQARTLRRPASFGTLMPAVYGQTALIHGPKPSRSVGLPPIPQPPRPPPDDRYIIVPGMFTPGPPQQPKAPSGHHSSRRTRHPTRRTLSEQHQAECQRRVHSGTYRPPTYDYIVYP